MKKIIKNFNNLIKKTIFKVQNKTNNNFNISSFNRYLIISISLLFVYLFYLLIPLSYNKAWVQTNIEKKLLNEFRINLSTSADISYRILPAPHFLIKDSKILVVEDKKDKSIAQIKDFKIFLSQKSFFNKEKMIINKIVINHANFSLLRGDFKLLNKMRNKKFSDKKIKINNSNIFFKDSFGDIVSIIKIDETSVFYDFEKLSNSINLKGEIFNVPFILDINNRNDSTKYHEIKFISKILKLDILNRSSTEKKLTSGKNNISFLKSMFKTKYNYEDRLIIFKSDNSRINTSKINYAGELSINPFDLNLNIDLGNYKTSKLFNINPILIELIKSGLLFNDNISVNTSISVNSKIKKEIFHIAKINFQIVNGRLNLDNTTFINNDIGLLKLSKSNLFLKDDNLILNTSVLFKIKNSERLFSFLNISKKSRKEIKNILVNLDYNFLKKEIKFNNVKIDNKDVNDQFLNVLEGFNDNNSNNLINSKRLINKLFSIYEG